MKRHLHSSRKTAFSSVPPPSTAQHLGAPFTTTLHGDSGNIPQLPSDPFRRNPSLKNKRPPPPVPDADGFVPMSPRQRRVLSYYDNVSPTASTNINNNSIVSNESIKRRNQKICDNNETGGKNLPSKTNVLRTNNNVTIVAIGDDEDGGNNSARFPYVPPPDYSGDDEEDEQIKSPRGAGATSGHFYEQMVQEDGKWQKPNPHLNQGSFKMQKAGSYYESAMNPSTTTIKRF